MGGRGLRLVDGRRGHGALGRCVGLGGQGEGVTRALQRPLRSSPDA